MNDRVVNFQLVKMEGDFVPRSPWWNVPRRFWNKVTGRQEMPKDPITHPACLEIIEGGSQSESRVVYRRS